MKRNWIIGMCFLIVAAIAVLSFVRCWNYGIVDLDDYLYVTYHKAVREWLGCQTVVHHFTNMSEGIWMPFTWFSYSLDWIFFGDWFGGFHLHSILIHALNTCLLWLFLHFVSKPLRDGHTNVPWNAVLLFAVLIWAIHPLRCESVVFVASRKDVLSFFWELLALIAWARGTIGRERRHTVMAMIFFVFGSLCKPSVMTFPVLCLLVDALAFREVRFLRYVAPVLYMLFLGVFASIQQAAGGATSDYFHQPLWGRLLGACAAFGIYHRNFIWPQWLAPQCIKTWPALPRFWLPGVIISGLWGWFLLRRFMGYWEKRSSSVEIVRENTFPIAAKFRFSPDYLFLGMAWFTIAIAPMLGIANFGYHAFADRFTYIPAVGISILALPVAAWLFERKAKALTAALISVIVLALSFCTWRQTGFWKDDFTLFSHTLEVDGDNNATAHHVLACWYFEFPHDLENCVKEYEKAISRDIYFASPSYWAYVVALAELGRESEIGDCIRRYEDYVTRTFGSERAHAIWADSGDLAPQEEIARSTHDICKLAWWLSDSNGLGSAKAFLERMNGPAFEEDSAWLFQRWKYHTMVGNKAEAKRLYDKLYAASKITNYIRFRYLFNNANR